MSTDNWQADLQLMDAALEGFESGPGRTYAMGYEAGRKVTDDQRVAAGWLRPDEAERLRAERDQAIAHDRQPYPTAEAYERACATREKHRERADKAEVVRDALAVQLADTVALLWPSGGARRVPFDHASQLPEAVEWLLQQRVSLTELLDKAESQLAVVQPVIDAARTLRQRLESDGSPLVIDHAYFAATRALAAAIDAADSPPEGPKQ